MYNYYIYKFYMVTTFLDKRSIIYNMVNNELILSKIR